MTIPAGLAEPLRAGSQYIILSQGGGRNGAACLRKFPELYDFCLFADTGDEKKATYVFLDKYVAPFCEKHGIQFAVLPNVEKLSEYIKRTGRFPSWNSRWCTTDWKIRPIRRFYRETLKASAKKPVIEHIGFAYDEQWRADRGETPKYIKREYPLIDAGITREGCDAILRQANWPLPPKSSCVGCFYQSKQQVREVSKTDPEAFARLAEIEESSHRYPEYKLFGRKWTVREIIEQKGLADFGFVKDEPEPDWVSGHCMSGNCGL